MEHSKPKKVDPSVITFVNILADLSERERSMLIYRHTKKMKYSEISAILKLSPERIRQILDEIYTKIINHNKKYGA